MSGPVKIRKATLDDVDQMLSIYAPFCEETAISFELTPPTVADFRERIVRIQDRYPWLALERDGAVIGYAYASQYMSRAAYRWSCDSSIYLAAGERGQGFGALLYNALLKLLGAQGFYNVYGGVTVPNGASEKLHESCGFEQFAVYKHVGWKLGQWHDVAWYRKELHLPVAQPAEPLTTAEVIHRLDFLA